MVVGLRADLQLPPEGLGMVLAPAGPFFFAGAGAGYDQIVMRRWRIAWRVALLAAAAMALGCAPRAGDAGRDAKTQALPETQTQAEEVEQPAIAGEEQTATPVVEQPATTSAPGEGTTFVSPFPGVRVRLTPPTVEVEAVRCLDEGWLEQIACSPGTREHESLVVVSAKPSHIHAALLMAGFNPGNPGAWIYHDDDQHIEVRPPSGDKLQIAMRYSTNGSATEEPVRAWIRDHLGERQFPDVPWIFAGSRIEPNPKFMGPGEHYVADQTGSIIGLVTFGDELIGCSAVIADQVDVQPAEWEVNTDAVPPVDTKVTIVITPWRE